jgi:hypothetical protein
MLITLTSFNKKDFQVSKIMIIFTL